MLLNVVAGLVLNQRPEHPVKRNEGSASRRKSTFGIHLTVSAFS